MESAFVVGVQEVPAVEGKDEILVLLTRLHLTSVKPEEVHAAVLEFVASGANEVPCPGPGWCGDQSNEFVFVGPSAQYGQVHLDHIEYWIMIFSEQAQKPDFCIDLEWAH